MLGALTQFGWPIASGTYRAACRRLLPTRARRDAWLSEQTRRVHVDNNGVYSARKVWLVVNREGIAVARCAIERLMRELGLRGVVRGRTRRTTIADQHAARRADLVQRRFSAGRPNRLWVADFTYVPTWSGMVYVALVIDVLSRRILGWRAAASMKTALVLDAPGVAIWARGRHGATDLSGLIHHHDAGSTRRSPSPNVWPRPASTHPSARSRIPTIMLWPSPRSGCSRPSSEPATSRPRNPAPPHRISPHRGDVPTLLAATEPGAVQFQRRGLHRVPR